MGNNLPIGFFDSGVGGLSVYARFRKLLPNENTIYFGDLKNLPYGNKSKEELLDIYKKFVQNILYHSLFRVITFTLSSLKSSYTGIIQVIIHFVYYRGIVSLNH